MTVMAVTRTGDRLLAFVDYVARQKAEAEAEKKYYSKTVGEYYRKLEDGGIIFPESGIYYSSSELYYMRNSSEKMKKAIHNVKKIMEGGEVIG